MTSKPIKIIAMQRQVNAMQSLDAFLDTKKLRTSHIHAHFYIGFILPQTICIENQAISAVHVEQIQQK